MRKDAIKWAREHRDGNKWNVWKALLVVGLISGAATGIINALFGGTDPNQVNPIGSFLSSALNIALLPMSVGLVYYVVNIVKGKKFELGQLFSRYSDFLRIFVSNLLVGIFVFLFALLLIIPGIIRAISYFLVNYILADPDFEKESAGEIPDLSRKIMDGHKGDYFMLNFYYFLIMLLGFIPPIVIAILIPVLDLTSYSVIMMLLSFIPLALLYVWIVPEMNLANAKFATTLLDNYKKEEKKETPKEEVKEEKKETKKQDKKNNK